MPENTNHLAVFDALYMSVFDNITEFFRYERRNAPDAIKFDDDWYARAGEAMKKRIDHELKYLHSPVLP